MAHLWQIPFNLGSSGSMRQFYFLMVQNDRAGEYIQEMVVLFAISAKRP